MSTALSPTISMQCGSKLPEPRLLRLEGKCIIEYIDTSPDLSATPQDMPLVVLAHGPPGAYMGFRYLVPLLWDNARTIGINLLGVSGSKILNHDSYYEYIGALQAVKLTYEALVRLCSVDDNMFFLGHSFGGHIAINLATLAAKNNHFKAGGMVLFASAEHRPHRSVRLVTNAVMAKMVSAEVSIISAAAKTLNPEGAAGYHDELVTRGRHLLISDMQA